MDYNGIAQDLRTEAIHKTRLFGNRSLISQLNLAATAIENLLLERDAAIYDLRCFGCKTCRHKGLRFNDEPCKFCKGTEGDV